MNAARFDHAEAIALVKAGATMTEVGAKFGVTRERIRQIVKRAGVVAPTGREFGGRMSEAVREFVLEGYGDDAIADLLELPTKTVVAARRRHGLKEGNWSGFAKQLISRELSGGRSIRSVSKQYGIAEETLAKLAKDIGIKSVHGRHRDFSARRDLIAKLRRDGLSWAEVASEMGKEEGRTYCSLAAWNWASKHAPDLIGQREAQA